MGLDQHAVASRSSQASVANTSLACSTKSCHMWSCELLRPTLTAIAGGVDPNEQRVVVLLALLARLGEVGVAVSREPSQRDTFLALVKSKAFYIVVLARFLRRPVAFDALEGIAGEEIGRQVD